MRTYLLLFTVSLVGALVLTPMIRRKALIWGAVDLPDHKRRIHKSPIPRLGGVAIVISFLFALLTAPLLDDRINSEYRENLLQVLSLLAPATLIFALGVYDDFKGIRATHKLYIQLIAAAMLHLSGFSITILSTPFGGAWEIPAALSFPLTAIWIVSITNAFNLIDGLDGLASGASIFALFSLFICSLYQGHPIVSVMSIILVGAVMGFLRYNFNPATIFLGDSGSLFLGFMAASLSLVSAQKGATLVAIAIPLISFGLPITEVGVSIARRFIGGDPLFQSDRRHIHHMLLQRGLNQRQTVILLYVVCGFFSLFGLMLLNPRRNLTAVIFIMVGIGVVVGVQSLRYAEFQALIRRIARGVTTYRRSLAAEVQVHRGGDELRAAQNADQIFDALTTLLVGSDLDSVVLKICESSTSLSENKRFPNETAYQWRQWSWTREDVLLNDVITSNRFWSSQVNLAAESGDMLGAITCYRDLTRRAPTGDLTQVCSLLQQELSVALERLQYGNHTVFQTAPTNSPFQGRLVNLQFPALEPDNHSRRD